MNLNSTMDRFRTVGISRFQFWLILQICKNAIEIINRWSAVDILFFKMKHKKCLLSWGWSQTLLLSLGGFTALFFILIIDKKDWQIKMMAVFFFFPHPSSHSQTLYIVHRPAREMELSFSSGKDSGGYPRDDSRGYPRDEVEWIIS